MTLAVQLSDTARSQPDSPSLPESEIEIRLRIDSLTEAIRHKNIDQLMPHYAPDLVVYDLLPPLDVRGFAAYRKNLEKWFASMAGRISYEMADVQVMAGDTHAYSFCLGHVTGARAGGGRADYWVRVTSGWQKIHGEWVVRHEHISMPTMMY